MNSPHVDLSMTLKLPSDVILLKETKMLYCKCWYLVTSVTVKGCHRDLLGNIHWVGLKNMLSDLTGDIL